MNEQTRSAEYSRESLNHTASCRDANKETNLEQTTKMKAFVGLACWPATYSGWGTIAAVFVAIYIYIYIATKTAAIVPQPE